MLTTHHLSPYYNVKMDSEEIRKTNFSTILAEFENELIARGEQPTLKRFGERYGLDPRHVSQMKNGSRGIGKVVARRIEKHHTPPLPTGWMDIQHGPGIPRDRTEAQIVDIVLDLYRDNPANVFRIISDVIKRQRDK